MDGNNQVQMTCNNVDPEMVRILEAMLAANETITARAVTRQHPKLNHASTITRSPDRLLLLKEFQKRQKQYREWHARAPNHSRNQLAAQLAQKDSQISELERQVEALLISHLAMIRTIGELGGMGKLLKLYEGCREIRNQLNNLHVLPLGEVK